MTSFFSSPSSQGQLTSNQHNHPCFRGGPWSKSLSVGQICVDIAVFSTARLNRETTNEYADRMASGAKFPPIIVYYDGENYWLADGLHRLEAVKQIKLLSLIANVLQGTRRDAILYSLSANAKHGLRRTNVDKRRAVVTLLSDPEWSHWSNREIARRCQVVEGLVRRVKAELAGLSAYSTHVSSAMLAQKLGLDEQVLLNAQHNLEIAATECLARRGNVVYRMRPATNPNSGGTNS